MAINWTFKLLSDKSDDTSVYKIRFRKRLLEDDGNYFVYSNSVILRFLIEKCNLFNVHIQKWILKRDYDYFFGDLYYPPKISFLKVRCNNVDFDLFLNDILSDKYLSDVIEIVSCKKCLF